MRFGRLDLNLLVALDALLTERSVSLAGERLFLSQSATSSALRRLRDYFGDELLVTKGRNMILTARGEELVEPVRAVLEQVRTSIAIAPSFDPATCDRTVRIMASDYTTQVLLADFFVEMETVAPNMRFDVQPMSENQIDALERGYIDLLATIDIAVSSDHPSEQLFVDDYVVIGDANNPAMQGPLSKEVYFQLGHVTPRFNRGKMPTFDEWFTRRQKKQRRIELVVPSFLSIAWPLVGSNRVATMHRRLANQLVCSLPLVLRELPFEIPPIREVVQWHVMNNNDRALRWVVERLSMIAGQPELQSGNVIPIVESERDELSFRWQQDAATR